MLWSLWLSQGMCRLRQFTSCCDVMCCATLCARIVRRALCVVVARLCLLGLSVGWLVVDCTCWSWAQRQRGSAGRQQQRLCHPRVPVPRAFGACARAVELPPRVQAHPLLVLQECLLHVAAVFLLIRNGGCIQACVRACVRACGVRDVFASTPLRAHVV